VSGGDRHHGRSAPAVIGLLNYRKQDASRMTKVRHTKLGVGAVAAYAAIVVITACVLYELGSGHLGYSSLTSKLFSPPIEQSDSARRYGKMLVKSDQYGNCRSYSLDNDTQQLVPGGTVVCDREQNARFKQRSRTDIFRQAFGGQH
jgi:hypothetical protein